MRSDSTKLVQSGLLLTFVFLTACDSDDVKSSCIPASAPAPVAASTPAPVITSMGTDFFLTLPDHICISDPAQCVHMPVSNKLIIASAAANMTATTGEVTFNGLITPFSVTAGGQVVISLDPPSYNSYDPNTYNSSPVLITNEVVEAKGIHVTSLAPVSVHVVSESAYSADGYLALPTAGLGTNYYVMSYSSLSQTGSEFAVVATQNATTVTITPKSAGSTHPAGTAFTVLLNSGETYQMQNPGNADMTGTYVSADKPIAVFSGHRFANVPSDKRWSDYMVEQLPDVSIWGKTHHTSLFSGRSDYTVRVMASQNNTTFTTIPAAHGAAIGTLNAGQFADVVLTGPGEFVSNNPVLVAQFIRGYDAETVLAKKGDPSMVMVTPAEQGMTDSTFGVYGLNRTILDPSPFMNVVTETAGLVNLKLDNVVVNPALFTSMGGTSIYSVGTIPVSPNAVHSLVGSAPYSALVYDYGIASNAVSYAYPVAATLTLPASAPATSTVTTSTANTLPAACVADVNAGGEQTHADSGNDSHARNDIHVHPHHGDNDGHHDDDDMLDYRA